MGEFEPWGKCVAGKTVWVHHHQRDPALMRRRYAREAAGGSHCGEGFPANVVCALAEQGKPLELKCRKGQIRKVLFASYGRQNYSTPGPCSEGSARARPLPRSAPRLSRRRRPSGLTIDPLCHFAGSEKLVADACIGRERCDSLVNTVDALGHDPCPGVHWDKRCAPRRRRAPPPPGP